MAFFVLKDPQSKKRFEQIARPKEEIQERSRAIANSCAYCTQSDAGRNAFQQCSRCKISSYCSRECQTKDWPTHKVFCTKAPISQEKLIRKFVANNFLQFIVEIACVTEFGLDKKPPVLNRPLVAKCHLAIRPHLTYIARLMSGMISPSELAKGTDGMIQMDSFEAASEDLIEPIRVGLWRNLKIQNPVICKDVSVVVIDFHIDDNPQGTSVCIPVIQTVIDLVKQGEGFDFGPSLLPGRRFIVPYSVEGCMDVINQHIRADEKNQLMLRKHIVCSPRRSGEVETLGKSDDNDQA